MANFFYTSLYYIDTADLSSMSQIVNLVHLR